MNDIAILERSSFLDMELFKPVFCATALVSIHIGRPFLSLLLDSETNYDTLIAAFPQLHKDLTTADINSFITITEGACNFISEEQFKTKVKPLGIIKAVA